MAFIGKVTATRGNLLRLRTTFKFVQNAMEILKMKRDRLAGELNELLNQLSKRTELEHKLMDSFTDLKTVLTSLGFATVTSASMAVPEMKVETNLTAVMGVIIPKVTTTQKARIDSIENPSLYNASRRLRNLIDDLLTMATVEASVERIAHELLTLNRKVNALEKVVIPAYSEQIRYIEDLLFDEDLEEFSRVKHIKSLAERKNA